MKNLLRYAAVGLTGLSLVAGVGVAGASSSSIDTTGPDSHNVVEFSNRDSVNVDNNNRVNVRNNNPQTAVSGDVDANHNTTVGDASSGSAHNDSMLRTNLSISNTSAGAAAMQNNGGWGDVDATINKTGPDSTNKIEYKNSTSTNVTNNNCVTVENNNSQSAVSGNVSANGNTTVGDLSSGNASNISTTDVTLSINN